MKLLMFFLVFLAACATASSPQDGGDQPDQPERRDVSWPGPVDDPESSPTPPNPAANQLALYESGSRIRAVVGETPGGAKMWMGWYDTEFEEFCSMGALVASSPYWLDRRDAWCAVGLRMSEVSPNWADPSCSTRVVDIQEPTSDYVRFRPDFSAAPDVFIRGDEYRGSVYHRAQGECVEKSDSSGRWWRLGDKVPSSRLAKFTVRVE